MKPSSSVMTSRITFVVPVKSLTVPAAVKETVNATSSLYVLVLEGSGDGDACTVPYDL